MATTREKLLDAAYEEIHQHGFQGMRVDEILARTGAAKGSLYHHFRNKDEIGYAVVEEVIQSFLDDMWLTPLADSDDPVATITDVLNNKLSRLDDDFLVKGCPLNNLAQEMSPIDEGFRQRLNNLFEQWVHAFEHAFDRGKAAGNVHVDVDSLSSARFVVAILEGTIGLAKTTRDKDVFRSCGEQLIGWLQTLRP